jgi:hypothetical protein
VLAHRAITFEPARPDGRMVPATGQARPVSQLSGEIGRLKTDRLWRAYLLYFQRGKSDQWWGMITTDEREKLMARLKDIATEMARLEAAAPTLREAQILVEHPKLPRERILRMVAAEFVDARR